MKSCRKLSKNCSIHGKNREIFGPYNFWTPIKSNIPDVWNWNFWTLFGSEIEVGGGGGMDPLAPPVATPLLVHSVPPKKKILSITAKDSQKIEIKFFP